MKTILEYIGNTPLVKIESIKDGAPVNIFAKVEGMNPGGSIKDRIVFNMITDAEARGVLKKGDTIVEPTSGNTGVAIAMIGAMKGYKVKLVMPKTTSPDKIKMITAFGGGIILIENDKFGKIAIEKIKERTKENEHLVFLNQYENKMNPQAHYTKTAEEIIEQMQGEPDIDFFVAGMGTGGTITGIGTKLKEKYPKIKIIGVEPAEGQIIEGLRSLKGFVPAVANLDLVDEVIDLETDKAFEARKDLAINKGILAGPSSGAAFYVVREVAKKNPGATIVTIFPDRGERYL
jgi:cysteine synthase